MKLADGIRKHGFRKWYERELLQSHAHLVLTFLCTIGIFAAIEAGGLFRSQQNQLLNIVAVVVCTGIGIWAMRRYLRLLSNAEVAAHQADCPQCKAYGRLEVVRASDDGDVVQVRCRKCGHGWSINT
jgi:ABC-type nickel/cobalt efflux system permease component RcnA